jgi:hypothetical protein
MKKNIKDKDEKNLQIKTKQWSKFKKSFMNRNGSLKG